MSQESIKAEHDPATSSSAPPPDLHLTLATIGPNPPLVVGVRRQGAGWEERIRTDRCQVVGLAVHRVAAGGPGIA